MILVTGGAGIIGVNFVLDWLSESREPVLNPDWVTNVQSGAYRDWVANQYAAA